MSDVVMEPYRIEFPIYHEARKAGTTHGFVLDGLGHVSLDSKGEPIKKVTSKGKMKTLVLRPSEYIEIRKRCDRLYQVIFDCLLYSGMRYQELLRLKEHSEWFDIERHRIFLPGGEGQKKLKRVANSRAIRLSDAGTIAMELLYDYKFPRHEIVDQYIYEKFDVIVPVEVIQLDNPKKTRWGTEILSYLNHPFSMKSFRKTYESWLIYYYDSRENFIAQSQGHNLDTQFRDYFSGSLNEKDRIDMRPFVEGWMR